MGMALFQQIVFIRQAETGFDQQAIVCQFMLWMIRLKFMLKWNVGLAWFDLKGQMLIAVLYVFLIIVFIPHSRGLCPPKDMFKS